MKIEELEARLKSLEDKNRKLEDKNRNLQDVEEIKKLQRIYGYYVERGQFDEVAELFSNSPDVSLELSKDLKVGKDNVRKTFSSERPFGISQGAKPKDYLHITMPVSGVVDVNSDGKTAKGRWYTLMYLCNATRGGGAVLGVGLYENDYIKEKGKWKILRLRFDDIFLSPYKDGWAKTPKVIKHKNIVESGSPFGDPIPFHYKHPITGKDVNKQSERLR